MMFRNNPKNNLGAFNSGTSVGALSHYLGTSGKTLFGLLVNIVTIPPEDYTSIFESKFNRPPFKIYFNNLINYEETNPGLLRNL
jgi:hypothetical protein